MSLKNPFSDKNNMNDSNNNCNSNNNNNNNSIIIITIIIIIIINNLPETREYWLDVQWGIVSSHGERDPL